MCASPVGSHSPVAYLPGELPVDHPDTDCLTQEHMVEAPVLANRIGQLYSQYTVYRPM